MTYLGGALICVFVSLCFAVLGLVSEYEVYVGRSEWTETKDWGDIAGGYQGNVGDKVTHTRKEYIDFILGENPLFIVLAIIFVLAIIAIFVLAHLRAKGKIRKDSNVLLIAGAIYGIGLPLIINTIQSFTYGYFVIFGLGTLFLIPAIINGIIYVLVDNHNDPVPSTE